MDEKPPIVEQNTAAEAPVAQPTPVVDDGEPKSYLAMMLLAFFAMPTGLARVYRGEHGGWIRFWIYVVASVLMIIPFVNIIAAIALLVVTIWGVVDFFLLYKVRTDAAGRPLHTTMRDAKAAKVLFILTIVGLAMSGVLLILGIIMAGYFMTTFQNGFNPNHNNAPLPHPLYNTPQSYN